MRLICACCGSEARARKQWHNQDTGYGLCSRCALWIIGREGKDYVSSCYGKEGVHYFLPEKCPTCNGAIAAGACVDGCGRR
jgi:hypothetical protein